MRITNLEIANFKGIKNAFITFPKDSRIMYNKLRKLENA